MPEPTIEITPSTVPSITTGTPSTVIPVDLGEVHPAAIDAAKELGLHKTLSPREALGADSLLEAEALEAQTAGKPLERDASGKFISRKDAKSELQGAEKPVETAKPAATAPMKAKLVSKAPAVTPEPAPVAKIKVGTEEKTAEEWQKHFEELKAQSGAAAAPKKPAQDAPKPPTAEEQAKAAQDLREQRLAFITKSGTDFNPAEHGLALTEAEYDKMLTGGPEALKAFNNIIGRTIAAAQAQAREWVVENVGSRLNALNERIAPVLQKEGQIAEYQQHQSFLTANPDIGAHEQGSNTSHAIREELHNNYQQMQERIATGTATPQDKAAALLYDSATPEQFEASVAYYTRAKLGIAPGAPKPIAATPAPSAVAPPTKPVTPKPSTPFNGDRPGGASTQTGGESKQSSFIRGLHEAGK